MPEQYRQRAEGLMTHPRQSWLTRFIFKTPLVMWRMGIQNPFQYPMLVLTTTGRKSGLPRHTMIGYGEQDGVKYLLSGWGDQADWYKNITASPHVTLQMKRGEVEYATVRRVTDMDEFTAVMGEILAHGGDAYFRPWLKSLDIEYDLDDLIEKRDRVFLVALDPLDEPGPLPLEADLKWVWGIVAAVVGLGGLAGLVGWRRRK